MRGIRTCVQIPIIQDNVINPLREGKNNTCCHTVGRRYIWELIREGFKKEEILALKQAFLGFIQLEIKVEAIQGRVNLSTNGHLFLY